MSGLHCGGALLATACVTHKTRWTSVSPGHLLVGRSATNEEGTNPYVQVARQSGPAGAKACEVRLVYDPYSSDGEKKQENSKGKGET